MAPARLPTAQTPRLPTDSTATTLTHRPAQGAEAARDRPAACRPWPAGRRAAEAGEAPGPAGSRARTGAPDRAGVRPRGERDPADVQKTVPVAGAHRAVLVHRQCDDPALGTGVDPVRRGHRAAARLAEIGRASC